MFQVFGVIDTFEGQKGDQGGGQKNGQNSTWGKTGHLQEGGPKMAKIQHGVKPDIFKRAAPKWPKFNMG